ncbi:Stk1 family PASTA domain-containing Ser/Thr kinase|uniref:non-specific serine/threonine protein kinase n=1 Tax=Dendrosporobacter quercicolus TaxID=146817 RepID=A0A1G9M3A9_9FIRM|nr:Stk1 family PASTA domain-containing Ser/Thr kinase [Dendrosporobacter quercicolus]NSL46898.1 Stk1 family PASTA domain-containing Ser/Thr kinase [Dendrosporobacter quercicolus DSM 1736]SDL68613.1 serine/threonine protein kinase [Dendrosporobacter quercicolus]
MLNRTLANRYTILEHIGGGGMADVYRAHDKLLDRSVAVKVLRPQFTNDDEFVTRFRREAQAAARLSHPNIVNMYDVGRDEDTDYIVMEYISGETLKEKIQREGPLPVEQAIRIAIEIAEALEHAHQNNLIHCDIKPHNILVTRSGRIKVTDFGIARAVTSATMTHTGTIIGSVHYFSPEQAKGSAIGAKSDIYSLGVVLYEMLTGEVPFSGETSVGIALKHLQEDPKPLQEINAAIPPLAEAVVLKAMAKEPEARFESSTEMIADLKMARNYLRDDQTRRLAREDFPTQVLPRITADGDDGSVSASNGKQKGNRKKLIGGLLALLLLGFAIGAFLAYGKFWSTSEVNVPNVVGKQVEVAKTMITGQNLRVSVTETYNETVPAGQVASQYPEAGATVKEQRTITLFVSKGAEITVVPDVRGLNRRDAELQIKNAGLRLGLVDEQYNDLPADTVVSQNPRPPAQVNKNTVIDLVISKGSGPRKLVMPDFRGSPVNTVDTQLDSLKLKLGTITEVADDKYPAGTITGQTPPPEAEVTEGSTVDFTVAKSTAGSAKRAIVQIAVPDGAAKQAVQIVVTDSNGRRVVYENVHKPGDKIEKTIEGAGQVRVQVYINGMLLQEQTI